MDQMKKFIDWLEQAESGMDTHIAFSVIVVGVGQFILHEFLFGIFLGLFLQNFNRNVTTRDIAILQGVFVPCSIMLSLRAS